MGNYDNGFADMLTGELVKKNDIARHLLFHAFPAWDNICGTDRAMELIFGGKSPLNLVAAKPLKNSQMSFSQTWIGDNSVPRGIGDFLGGLNRPPEIAAIKRSEFFSSQSFGQCFGLRQSPLGQRTVEMPL